MSLRRAPDLTAPLIVILPLVAVSSAVVDAVLLNQSLAVALWGALLVAWGAGSSRGAASASPATFSVPSSAVGLALALGVVAAFSLMSRWRGDAWPVEIGVIAAAATVGAAACIAAVGAHRSATAHPGEPTRSAEFAWGWWAAGSLCVAIAALQYFAAEATRGLSDVGLLASSSASGRAVGNMRQPNHLATALVCAMVWTAWLWQTRRLPAWAAGASIAAIVFAVALSASRTGALSLAVLVLWALIDRRLPRGARWLLAVTPLIYLTCWFGLAEWAALQQGRYYGAERLQAAAADPSSSRFAIWKNALALVAMHPWTGVGWGNFNFAWTFTPFPDRPRAFFDHTHNLPLQLAAEIGLPATALVLGLLIWALWRSRGAWSGAHLNDAARQGTPARAAFAMLVVLGVHSLLEYPLWYAYFLLPAAWALGLFIGSAPVLPRPAAAAASRSWPSWLLAACGVAMIAGSAYALWDHRRIDRIFEATPGAAPLAERIADGRRSRLFGHHADYAAVTNEPRDTALASFRRPLLQLVDVRLMTAYIEALKAAGQDRKALYAAQRLREFKRDDAQAYFKDCDGPAPPFQCEREPVTGLTWRDMLP